MKLALLMGGPPKGDKEKADPARNYAREAFSALKDDDEDGFIEALLALKSCKGGGMEPDADDEEDDDGEDY